MIVESFLRLLHLNNIFGGIHLSLVGNSVNKKFIKFPWTDLAANDMTGVRWSAMTVARINIWH